MAPELSPHMKWLFSVIAGGWLVCQVWDRLAAGIEQSITERVRTSATLIELGNEARRNKDALEAEDMRIQTKFTGQINDTKTWLDGRVNTQAETLSGMRRELDALKARAVHAPVE